MEESEDVEDRPVYRVSAYVQAFDDTIAFALHNNSNLWTAHETQLLLQCTPEHLHEGARLLLSRLSLRKAKWMKSSSVSHYVPFNPSNSNTDSESQLLQSINTLQAFSFLEILTTNTPFETAFEAVQACFLSDDLTRLYKRLTTNKNTTNNNKTMSKEELLSAIHQAVRTQRTLFGHSLSHKFAPAVLEVVKEASTAPVWNNYRTTTDTSSTSNNNAKNTKNKTDPKNCVVLRINPQILHLLRRCQRLYQISCNANSSSYTHTTNTATNINYNATGAAAANNTSAATTGFASVLTPLDFNAPLLVLFNKTRYPEYMQGCRCGGGGGGSGSCSGGGSGSGGGNDDTIDSAMMDADEVSTTVNTVDTVHSTVSVRNSTPHHSNIFPSQLGFVQWEGAVELHAACLDKGIQDLLLDNRSTDKLHILIASFESDSFIRSLVSGDSVTNSGSGSSTSNTLTLYRLAQACGLTTVFDATITTTTSDAVATITTTTTTTTTHTADSISNSITIDDTDQLLPAAAITTTKKKSTSVAKTRASNTNIDLSALSSAHLLAVLCLLSYCHKYSDDSSNTGSNRSGGDNEGGFADHMLKFDAGTQLVYACSDGATQAEKEPFRQYLFAIVVYELLLHLPYLPHRRGYWYKRLCIDYSHVGLHRCALRVCYRCLGDSCVNVSDKTDLASRATSLQAKILKQYTASAKNGKPTKGSKSSKSSGIKMECDDDGSAGGASCGDEGRSVDGSVSVYAIERDVPSICLHNANATYIDGSTVEMSIEVDPVETEHVEPEPTVRKSRRSRTAKSEPVDDAYASTTTTTITDVTQTTNTSTTTNATSTISTTLTDVVSSNIGYNVLTVLCMINLLPTSTSRYDAFNVVDVLYNCIMYAILHSPHATSIQYTDTTTLSTVSIADVQPLVATNTSIMNTITASATTTVVNDNTTNNGFALLHRAHTHSETGKRKESPVHSTYTTNTSIKISKSYTTTTNHRSSVVEWSCTVCTFINTTERFCAMCMQPRAVSSNNNITTTAVNTTTKTSSSGKKSNTSTLSTFLSTTKLIDNGNANANVGNGGTRSSNGGDVIVDLISDDEVEVVPVDTFIKAHTVNIIDTANMKSSASIATAEAVQTDSGSKGTSAMSGLTHARENDAQTPTTNTTLLDLAPIKQHISTTYTKIMQTLSLLLQSRLDIAILTTTSTVLNTTSKNLSSALNTAIDSGDGEEEDDLVLLGLLSPHTATTTTNTMTDATTSIKSEPSFTGTISSIESNVRPSLESLIPAPPFFVVTGRRTGDPSSRKGKSKFCGLNDELVNVETYVMQKCHLIDPDDCENEVSTGGDGIGSANENSYVASDGLEVTVEGKEEALFSEYVNTELPSPDTNRNRRSCRTKRTVHASSDSADNQPTMASSTTAATRIITTTTTNSKPTRQVPYTIAIDNGGWQGWHCEGSIFQTLFGLLTWDVLFACPACSSGSSNSDSDRSGVVGGNMIKNEYSTSANTTNITAVTTTHTTTTTTTTTTIATTTNYCVFVTPFQDAPLDLGHRSFYRTRRHAIQQRILHISTLTTHQLIAELGTVYRAHYGENCRGVHWGVTLPLLQLMAVCMGSSTVSSVCRALSVNCKHFTGGAPDLMLVRVQRRVVRHDSLCMVCSGCGHNGGDNIMTIYPVTEYEIVPVPTILGMDWQSQLHSPVVLPKRVYTSTNSANNAIVSNIKTTGDGSTGGDGDNYYYEPNEHIRDLFLPTLAPTPDTSDADPNRSTTNITTPICIQCATPYTTTSTYTYEYKLEARFIEVKGPTDSLMFRQRVWLHILNSSAVPGTGSGPNYSAYVCHVKEQ